jgi:hypothetical protein
MSNIRLFLRVLLLAALAASSDVEYAGAANCASSQTECDSCCEDAAQACYRCGGMPNGDCIYSPGPPSAVCTRPGCFGGSPCQ